MNLLERCTAYQIRRGKACKHNEKCKIVECACTLLFHKNSIKEEEIAI